jgi:phage shock protein A
MLQQWRTLENRYLQAMAQADEWGRRAKLALDKGNPELSQAAKRKEAYFRESAGALKGQMLVFKGKLPDIEIRLQLHEQRWEQGDNSG